MNNANDYLEISEITGPLPHEVYLHLLPCFGNGLFIITTINTSTKSIPNTHQQQPPQ